MNSWMIHNPGKRNTIYDLAPLICSSWDKAAIQINIKSAFMCTGIHHLYNSIVDELDFVSAFVTDRPLSHITFNIQYSIDSIAKKVQHCFHYTCCVTRTGASFSKTRKNLTRQEILINVELLQKRKS